MARGGIRFVRGHTKSTLITYFSGMKIDPKYAICMHFSSFVRHVLSKICLFDQKHTLFSNFACFCTLNVVRAYSAWSWKTTLITWIFGRAWYPLDVRVAPPPRVCPSLKMERFHTYILTLMSQQVGIWIMYNSSLDTQFWYKLTCWPGTTWLLHSLFHIQGEQMN